MNNLPLAASQALELLDGYLARLQAGEVPDRETLLREHPELASAFDCMDALEGLAPEQLGGAMDDGEALTGELPRTFGQYELLSEVGRGGMGVVYRARQEGLDRIVAVKMILAGQPGPRHGNDGRAPAKPGARPGSS